MRGPAGCHRGLRWGSRAVGEPSHRMRFEALVADEPRRVVMELAGDAALRRAVARDGARCYNGRPAAARRHAIGASPVVVLWKTSCRLGPCCLRRGAALSTCATVPTLCPVRGHGHRHGRQRHARASAPSRAHITEPGLGHPLAAAGRCARSPATACRSGFGSWHGGASRGKATSGRPCRWWAQLGRRAGERYSA